uniref:Uncharacterized protein n=1 Tax=Anopheles minimus TaxID=112268 RepID=A0A182VXV4_9DIPT
AKRRFKSIFKLNRKQKSFSPVFTLYILFAKQDPLAHDANRDSIFREILRRCVRVPARNTSARISEICSKNSSDDGNGMAKPGRAAISRLGSVYDPCTRTTCAAVSTSAHGHCDTILNCG